MRQVRKKSADSAARPYLLKAKKEGLQLSWNRYENMLPQDGFGKLGLTCFDCLQGPCRLNPFSQEEERAICGRTKDDLALNNILRIMSNTGFKKGQGLSVKEKLVKAAQAGIQKVKNSKTSFGKKVDSKQIGLGVLETETVNICLESVSQEVLDMCHQLAQEMKQEATDRGAQGFKIVLAGDVTPVYPFATVSNAGGVEFALLTGLVDLYAVGSTGLGLGKNVVSSYHTVYRDADNDLSKDELKHWFIQAAVAYTKRDSGKVLVCNQIGEAQLYTIDASLLKAHLEQGSFSQICVLAGGSAVSVTEDALICEAAKVFAGQNVLCLTYGNAAATLGKYGLLDNSSVKWVGSEAGILDILDLVDEVGANNVLVLVPELSTAEDLQGALALSGKGTKVFTAVRLPVDGSTSVAQEIDELIQYCEPKDFLSKVTAALEV